MNWDQMISRAAQSIPPSGIRRFFDLAAEMKESVISLSIGEPDFVTPWSIRDAGIYSLEQGHTHYSPNAGYLKLRQAIASYMNDRFDLQYCEKDEMIVTVGGSEAIDLMIRAVINPGDEVIISEPCFVSYKACVSLASGVPVVISGQPDNGFKITAEQLDAAMTNRTKLVILGYPSNPTGAVLDRDEVIAIADVIKKHSIFVLSDELYAELTYPPHEHFSIAAVPGMKDRTVVVNGFSKAFAMTGWRIGFACGPAPLIAAMHKIHQYAIMCSPSVAQEAACEALQDAPRHIAAMRDAYDQRRRLVLHACREAGLPCYEPRGAFYVFPDIRPTGLTSALFCERFLREEKVAIVPGEAFGDCGQGFVRISYATSTDNLREAMVRLRRFVKRSQIHAGI